MNILRIALDGPSGAGKSSLAKEIARRLNIVYLDTGALYRTVGLYAKQKGVNPSDAQAMAAILPTLSLDVRMEEDGQHVYLNGGDVGDSIRTPEMSKYASAVSALPVVRAFLLDTQRNFAAHHSVIMDGRDIGTVILPDADVKIFLTASAKARARRRHAELTVKGIETTLEQVLADMEQLDRNDATRDAAPCVAAEDAVLLDNSNLSVKGTVTVALAIIQAKVEEKSE